MPHKQQGRSPGARRVAIHQPMPPTGTQARLPIELGMLQRLRVLTAEFPLNVHVVNVAEPPVMYITPPCNVRRHNQGPHHRLRIVLHAALPARPAKPHGPHRLHHPDAACAMPLPIHSGGRRSNAQPPEGRFVAHEREEALVQTA